MLEFLLSRLTMSLCAVIVLAALMPLVSSLPTNEHDSTFDSLKELASRFYEVANCPGEPRMELDVSVFLLEDDDRFILRRQTLWLESGEERLASPIPDAFKIYLDSEGEEVELVEARLGWSSKLVLSKLQTRDGAVLEAHIENLDATSDTLSANF